MIDNVRYGFLIKEGKIFDTQRMEYQLKRKVVAGNIIYYMEACAYKRLPMFEALLCRYPIDKVYRMLNFNKHLKKEREKAMSRKNQKNHYMANYATIYNYPPTYLTQKKFTVYKICQKLKKKLV